MTDEFEWPVEGETRTRDSGPTDELRSRGFTFSEQSSSPALPVASGPDAGVDSDAHSRTALVPMSRRALREAERADTPSRRSRRRDVAPADNAGGAASQATPTAAPTATATASARATKPALSLRRRIAQKAFPPVVMVAAAGLLVGTSVPASALFDPDAPPASTAMAAIAMTTESDDEPLTGQVVDVEATGDLAATTASRDEWTVTSYAEMLRLRYGNRDFSYSTSGTGPVRWPFPFAVPISSGFGERVAPCRSCSSYHQGLDFNPGAGTPIFAIADGIVIKAEHSGGFGNHAIIQHIINGQRVTSTYAHMTRDSSPLVVGEEIRVGDFVGTVGSTGVSTGAHLHFEIRIDDIAIDPFAWLKANAG